MLNAGGGLFGVFRNVTTGQRLTTADGVGSFVVNYGPGSVFNQNQIVLSNFRLAADFDADNDVDGDDLARWRTNFGLAAGATSAQGDADGNGRVDGRDFLTWQRQRGGVTTAVENGSTVPEPGGILLALAALARLAPAAARRRR